MVSLNKLLDIVFYLCYTIGRITTKGDGDLRKLRRVREDKMLSLRDVAEDLDVNHSLISYWERSVRNPSKANAKKLEEYFETDIDYLMSKDEHMESQKNVGVI